jgi:pimeloyl-ACP methyl ester carboxylesterase
VIRARAIRGFGGAASGTVTTGSRTYASSIDAGIADLKAEYAYDTGFSRRPILVLMHGYARGFFVVVPGMRGRSSASGARDSSGREIQDVIDAVEDARAGFAAHVDPDRVAIAGYSGGGGNALAAIAKAPDYWTHVVSHFGPSDYGWRTTGWYYTDTGFQTDLTTDVGAAPGTQPGWWRSRNHADALAYQLALAPRGFGARLSLYHDADDASVDVAQSDRVRDVLEAAGLEELLDYHRSTSLDSVRYLHGYPADSAGVLAAEADWTARALNAQAWKVPERGEVLVAGYLVTKRFQIWLGLTSGGANPKTDAAGGKVHVARVRYDTLAGTFDLLPLTGAVRYRIELGAVTATGDTADPVEVTPS